MIPVAVGPLNLKGGDDFRVMYFRARVAVTIANKRIASGKACVVKQRAAYGAKR